MAIKNLEMQGVMNLLVGSLHLKLNETKIGEVKHSVAKKIPVEDTSKKYDKNSISDFLTLYKLEYLEEHKLLDEETIRSLRELFHKRELLEGAFNELSLMRLSTEDPSIDTRMSEVFTEMNEINAIFQAYHIDFTTEGLESMLLSELNCYETPAESTIDVSTK